MEVYLYRYFLTHKQLVPIPTEQAWLYDGNFDPRPEDGELRHQMTCCRYMAHFFKRHGLPVTHWLAVVRGWTVEYVEVQ